MPRKKGWFNVVNADKEIEKLGQDLRVSDALEREKW